MMRHSNTASWGSLGNVFSLYYGLCDVCPALSDIRMTWLVNHIHVHLHYHLSSDELCVPLAFRCVIQL
jgi:hypothetical protein